MSFYNELSKYYKYIFPTNQSTVDFLINHFSSDENILDIACGSGEYTVSLAKNNYDIIGIDLETEMIEKATEKAKEDNLKVTFQVGNMLFLDDKFEANSIGGIFCIGNSLVNLDTIEDVKLSLESMYRILKFNRILVIQIVNYDRILKFNLTGLPTIINEKAKIEFIRDYVYENSKISFNTTLKTVDGVFYNSVKLLPLTSNSLTTLLKEIGFKDINLYGGFNKSKFDINNFIPLVLTCKK
ncbi:class I SAM-dependent methyltransferase [Clostridium uliginosum]|uniref:Methyltransferase domain-containing protein n=1 Tax=Clostridium uliginosum TaxID=119641 RepID=A0A1I1STR6_9CLOT|nr:class I SAM-dependent methyltransferase [Clostridium uliginosum]SFD48138.1 Methyltransferase domain-containing protein [Clostridium uliginosum]